MNDIDFSHTDDNPDEYADQFIKENYPHLWPGEEIVDFVGDPKLIEKIKKQILKKISNPHSLEYSPNVVEIMGGKVCLRRLRGDFVYVHIAGNSDCSVYLVQHNDYTIYVSVYAEDDE